LIIGCAILTSKSVSRLLPGTSPVTAGCGHGVGQRTSSVDACSPGCGSRRLAWKNAQTCVSAKVRGLIYLTFVTWLAYLIMMKLEFRNAGGCVS